MVRVQSGKQTLQIVHWQFDCPSRVLRSGTRVYQHENDRNKIFPRIFLV